MALTKIDDCHLYVAFTEHAAECGQFKEWLEQNNIDFELMLFNYTPHQKEVLSAVSTWWDGVTFDKFPFFIYTEIHDDLKPSRYPRKYFKTLEEIKNSDFLEKYKLGR